jgi:hypothetical protein
MLRKENMLTFSLFIIGKISITTAPSLQMYCSWKPWIVMWTLNWKVSVSSSNMNSQKRIWNKKQYHFLKKHKKMSINYNIQKDHVTPECCGLVTGFLDLLQGHSTLETNYLFLHRVFCLLLYVIVCPQPFEICKE